MDKFSALNSALLPTPAPLPWFGSQLRGILDTCMHCVVNRLLHLQVKEGSKEAGNAWNQVLSVVTSLC